VISATGQVIAQREVVAESADAELEAAAEDEP
jgi:hypothetical protein